MSESMIPYYCADFKVKELCTTDDVSLMGAIKGLFVHFVVHRNNRLSQYYVHRHEWASLLLDADRAEISNKTLSCGLQVSVNISQSIAGVQYDGIELQFSLKKTALGKQLLKDAAALAEVKQASKGKDFKQTTLTQLNGDYDTEFPEKLSLWEVEAAAFEQKILPSLKKHDSTTGICDILLLKDSAKIPLFYFMEKANWVVTTNSCNCGNDGCFYSVLNHTFITHFSDKQQFLIGDQVDEENLANAFKAFWSNLSTSHKAVLLFLDDQYENTALLNMAMLNSDFDLNEFQRLLTYPYQPDSDDEAFVRTTSSLVWYYLSLNQIYSINP